MQRHRVVGLVVLLLAFAAASSIAGDATGKWVAEFTSPDGQTRQSTFHFKVEGDILTGTVSGRSSDVTIEEGMVDGDSISFSVTRNWGQGDVKFHYAGTVQDDEIQMTVTIEGGDRTFDLTAKRVPE
jgi:hypothetical protein